MTYIDEEERSQEERVARLREELENSVERRWLLSRCLLIRTKNFYATY